MDRIKKLTKLCIVRELNMLDERKDARRYAEQRLPTMSEFDIEKEERSLNKSVAAISQYSGSRASPSPHKK